MKWGAYLCRPSSRCSPHSPFDRLQRTFQVVDNITWQRDNHSVRAGVEWAHC